MKDRLLYLTEHLFQAKVLIIGDLMLDCYLTGKTERISPEAPVQVVEFEAENNYLGGAANVARNLASTGGKVDIIGIVGEDKESTTFLQLLKKEKIKGYLVRSKARLTTKKTRIISRNQQLLRIDREVKTELTEAETNSLKEKIQSVITDHNFIIISDYAKGTINQKIFDFILKNKKPETSVIVDPKPRHNIYYHGANIITPNAKEAEMLTGISDAERNFEVIAEKLKVKNASNVLITLGEKGMFLLTSEKSRLISTIARQVYDVSGAGDTVIAICTACLSIGATIEEAAEMATIAAGIVVGKMGTSTVSKDELKDFILTNSNLIKAFKNAN